MTAFKWEAMKGSAEGLKWNRRELPNLNAVIARVPGRTCAVQAGGNLGIWPKRLSQEFQTVLTFEPAADLFLCLVANAPEPNILRYQAALGYERALVGVSRQRRDGKPNNHEGITHISGVGIVPTLRVDDFALPTCDLICLDIEGWEFYALQGAEATIRRCRPVLAVEVNKSLAFVGLAAETVRGYLTDLGYRQVDRLQSDDVWVPEERVA